MTNPNYTWLLLVIDRSGSMTAIRSDAEGAVNALLQDQAKQPGNCDVELVTFDHIVETHTPLTDIKHVPEFQLRPRANTALHDAVGMTINSTGERLAAMPEDQRPGHVVLAVVTDGLENASVEYKNKIKPMIERQRDEYGWEFTFLSAGEDAVLAGASMGIPARSSLSFQNTGASVQSAVASASAYVTNTRSGREASYTDEDRKSSMMTWKGDS